MWRGDMHSVTKRNAKMTLSGRKDAKYGNFVFQYDAQSQTLHVRSITGQALILPYVYFPYGQDQVQESIATQLSCQNKKRRMASQSVGPSKTMVRTTSSNA
ncbi:hypothetical protein GCM10020331_064990 [Ectobacillus funiculus]